MNVKLFGNRVLVERYVPQNKDRKIVIPDATQQFDSHRIGKVVAIGDGKTKTGTVPSIVKIGDLVTFQINEIMEATQKFALHGKAYMNLLQTELIGKLITGDEVTLENFQVLGDYLILKHFIRQPTNSLIVVPEAAARQSAPEFIYFKCLAKGATVDKPIDAGSELIVNLGRLTPMFFQKRASGGTMENEELCYTHKDWVDGVIEDASTN